MSIVRNKKALLTTAVVLLVSCLLAVALFINLKHLDNVQNEALEELEERIGEYDERSIVLYGTSKAKASKLATRFGAELRITSNGRFATLTLPEDTTIRDIFADKENLLYIQDMSADYQVHTSELEEIEGYVSEKLVERPYAEVTDEGYILQSYLDYLNIRNVWEFNKGSGVTIAVIDTGIDTDHPEFQGIISEYSYNATEDKIVKDYVLESGEYDWSLIEDEQGHGTAVSGVIAAPMNNGGIVGIAPEAEIIAIKAECDELGRFKRTSDLVFGLYYAIERDVDVVNMSFGTGENVFEEATQLAYDSDIICVAAAGNDSTTMLTYPAANKNVIGIGALASTGWELADYSNYGENTNMVAPGTAYTAKMGGGYGNMTGTSFASPIVAGAVALYMQNNQYVTFDQVTEALYISTYDLGDLGNDWYFGFGALDIYSLICGERGEITYDMLTDELDNIEGKFIRGHALQELPEPERLYAVFDGWYYDDTFTQEYNYYTDRFESDLTLYAKWVNEDDGVPYIYVELDDGTVEIRSYTGKRKYITVPDMINGKPVSSIGDFAFENNYKLREVVLPDSLHHIGIGAFANCSNLVTIHIPENVTEIETEAFKNNVRLSTVAFRGNSKLTSIGDYAFAYCSSLREFVVPSGVKNLNGSAFFGDSSLKSIKVQKGSVDFSSNDGVLFDYSGSTLVAFPAAKSNTYTLPNNTTDIGDFAFGYCKLESIDLSKVQRLGVNSFANSMLRAVKIPDSVVNAGKGAFAGCLYLSDVTIGRGLAIISQEMFKNNISLKKIVIPNTVFGIDMKAFEKSALKEVIFEENSVLTEIGGCVFAECQIEKIDIPDSVVAIGNNAFAYNPLTEVNFGENSQLWGIGDEAFSNCAFLESVFLPDRLEYIGDRAFQLSGLKSVTVPASVTQLGYGAFAGCNITAIEIEEGNAVYYDTDGVVYTKDNLVLHSYPSGKADMTYTVKNGVETVAPYAFAYASVYSPVLPESLVQISEYAFYSASISEISIPDNVMQIGRFAFAYTNNLQTISFTENAKLPRISYQAFAYSSMYSFTVPANVSTIAQGAFEGAKNLSQITFAKDSKLESISAYMFDGCKNLSSVIFEEGSALTSIQAHGFEGMANLRYVDFGNAELENVDNFAFRFCTNLQDISFPSTLKSVGRYAFYGCKSLSKLSFSETLEHIGSYAFLGTNSIDIFFAAETLPLYLDENWDKEVRGYYTGVTNIYEQGDYEYAVLSSGNIAIIEYLGNETEIDLTKLDFGGKITIIGGGAFKDSGVKTVVLPETLTSVQAEAFAYAPLESITIPQNVTFIGREAFAHTRISSLVFDGASKINFIEQYAFTGTKELKSVTLPASLTTMGTGVFMQSGITSVTFAQGISLTEIPQKAFAETKLTSVSLPNSVVLVNHNAFNNVQTLKSVSFGNNDGIRLMSNAFYHTGLETLHIPANVTYIGEYCFVALTNLETITVDANNPNYTSVDGLLLSKNGRKLITAPAGRSGILTLPVSVEEIGFGAFEESKLTQVLFDKNANILSLGYRAFFKSSITEITVPASVVAVDYYAFAYCDDLTTVIFEDGSNLKGIYEGAFCGDGNLENIVIPASIVEISEFAFYSCTKIKDIPVENNEQLKGIFDYAFAYTGINGELVIPESVIDIGSYAFRGTEITKLIIPDTNKLDLLIGIGAFQECNKLEEATLPFVGASYDDIFESWLGYIFGAGSYQANPTYVPSSLKKVDISDGMTILGDGAFYGCANIEEVRMPETVSLIGYETFTDCPAKHSFSNPISVFYIDWTGAFAYHEYIYTNDMGRGVSGTLEFAEGVKYIDLIELQIEKLILPDTAESLSVTQCYSLKELVLSNNLMNITCWNLYALESVVLPESIETFRFYGCANLKKAVLPANLTEIPAEAFRGCGLENIDIPDAVTVIGQYAFGGCGFKRLELPNSLERIEEAAFNGCFNLIEVELPPSITYIGDMAFENCRNLSKINLPKGLEYIGNEAFSYCDSLYEIVNDSSLELSFESTDHGGVAYYAKTITEKHGTVRYKAESTGFETIVTADGFWFAKENSAYKLTAYTGDRKTITLPTDINGSEYIISHFKGGENIIIPDGIKEIGGTAFYQNRTIKSIVIADSVTRIGYSAFWECNNLEKVVLSSSVKEIEGSTFEYCTSLKEITIPEGVITINGYAFEHCTSLESVVLPDSLENIYQYAFHDTALSGVLYIPENVSYIDPSAFNECNITGLDLDKDNANFKEIDGMLYNSDVTRFAYVPDGITKICIPATINNIDNAFDNKAFLETVTFEEGSILDNIGIYAFSNCSNLKSVQIPESVKSIRYGAFLSCTNLENIVLPSKLVTIEEMAFNGCQRINTIRLPATVSEVGWDAFTECYNIESFTVSLDNPYLVMKDGVLYDKGKTQILFVSYREAIDVVIPDTVTLLRDFTFYRRDKMRSIHLPEGITELPSTLFGGCSSLEYVYIPETVTSIGFMAFEGCVALESVNLPDSLEKIDGYAFLNCNSLINVNMPKTLKSIEYDAFSGCTALLQIEIPNGVEEIPKYAFSGCYSLIRVVLPENLKTIYTSAFQNCENLIEIVNNSNIPLTFGSQNNGCIAEHAKIITDKNGNRIYREGYEDYEAIITTEDFLFVKDNGTYYLRAYLGDKDTVTLPKDINGSDYIIYRFIGAKNIIVPEGRKRIDDYAFYFDGSRYGYNCTATIESIALPDGLTEIGEGAFHSLKLLKTINIPDTVTRIGDHAFFDCRSLEEIVIPSSVEYLGYDSFRYCESLEKIVLPNTIESIPPDLFLESKFYNDPANWEDGCLYIGTNLIKVSEYATHIEVRDDTTCIAQNAFNGCHLLKMITAPATLGGAFMGASNIETLVIKGYGAEYHDGIFGALGWHQPITLKYIVLESEFELSIDSYLNVFDMISDITIFVEKEEENLRWDANFPGWSNENRVIYGDDWTWLEFKDGNGDIIYRQPRLINQVIVRPYISTPAPVGNIAYKFVGWDVDGDGIADNIPATSAVDVSAKAMFIEVERKHTVSFVDEDGKVISSSVLDYGAAITAPAIPQKKGHTFMGWSDFKEGLIAEKDVVFTAQWKHDGNGHAWSAPSVVAPTCTEQGYTVITCSICDQQVISNITSPVGHNWGDVIETAKPTCDTDGLGYRVCKVCGATENVVIEMNGHDFAAFEETLSTCEKHGKIGHKCSDCGKAVENKKELASHSYVKQEINESTANALRKSISGIFILKENGKYACYKCSECDRFMLASENTFNSSASVQSGCRHANLSEWKELIPADCVSFGIEVRYCLDCDKPFDVRIGAAAGTGHAFGEWIVTVAPTCTSVGQGKHSCTICGHSETGEIPMIEHTYMDTVTKPTCTEGGYTTHTCSCGDSYVDTYTNATGHTYGEWYTTVAPTESEQGEKRRDCSDCDAYETAVLEVLDHDHYRWDPIVLEAKNPTCTVPGLTEGSKCSKCGEILTSQKEIPATGHSFGNWFVTKAPTCTEKGEKKRECSACDHFETRVVDKLAHTYVDTVTKPTCTEQGYTTHTCECGDSYVDTYTEALGHSFTNYVSDGNATLEADGTKTALCDHGCGTKDTVTDEGSKLEFNDITSDIYKVKDGFISGISIKTTVKELKESVNETKYVRVVKDGKVVEDKTVLSTGMKIQLMNGSEVLKEITVVVTGDTNGDGNISVTDMISVKAHILKKSTLTHAYAKAGDTNNDGSISITDFIQIKAHILGKSSLEKNTIKTYSAAKYNAAPVTVQKNVKPTPKKEVALASDSVCCMCIADFLVPARFTLLTGTETIKRSF